MGIRSIVGKRSVCCGENDQCEIGAASTKPAFADSLKCRRCLIPADAFYEWKNDGKAKQPYCFEVNDGALFAFAGIWDRWKDPGGTFVQTCSILTTSPNSVTRAVHARMPVILDAPDFDLWLDPGMKNVAEVLQLLRPYDVHPMRCYPVSHRVNNVINDDDACSEQVNPAIVQDRLFS